MADCIAAVCFTEKEFLKHVVPECFAKLIACQFHPSSKGRFSSTIQAQCIMRMHCCSSIHQLPVATKTHKEHCWGDSQLCASPAPRAKCWRLAKQVPADDHYSGGPCLCAQITPAHQCHLEPGMPAAPPEALGATAAPCAPRARASDPNRPALGRVPYAK